MCRALIQARKTCETSERNLRAVSADACRAGKEQYEDYEKMRTTFFCNKLDGHFQRKKLFFNAIEIERTCVSEGETKSVNDRLRGTFSHIGEYLYYVASPTGVEMRAANSR